MNSFLVRLTFVIISLLQFSATVYAGTLDDYYLQQFGESKNLQLQKTLLSATTDVQEPARCGTPLKHALQRDWNLLEQSTQKVLAKQLALPTLSGPEQSVISSGGHFKIHYTTSGADAPNINLINQYTGLGLTSATDWANTVAATFEYVYAQYASRGYQPAPTTSGTPYDIYLNDQVWQGNYGVTNSGQPASPVRYPNSFTSWMELDSSFTSSIFHPSSYTPLQSLQITAAHEYHHAIQYGYSFYFDIWYAEATSTWMEDELYDSVNQNYSYIQAWFNDSTSQLDLSQSDPIFNSEAYGRWILNRYLAEKRGVSMIRNAWEKLGTLPSPGNGADIPMTPVLDGVLSSTYGSSLGNDYFGFTKRVYDRNWTNHSYDTTRIPSYSPVAAYAAYPVNSGSGSTALNPITLPHYSFAYYKFVPAPTAPTVHSLTITIAKSSGIQTAVFRKSSGGITEITANTGGNSYTDNTFSSSDELVLLIANTSSSDGHNANFSTDGKLIAVIEPPTTTTTTSSNKNGCFIATAAYGSYLHPQVQLLRNFRDNYLLTNAPGRAFVSIYYRFSPPLADFIASHSILRSIARLVLTPLVVVVAYPLISAVSLFLLIGTALLLRLRRMAHLNITSNTTSRI